MSEAKLDFCYGNQAARELLETAEKILSSPENYASHVVTMAAVSAKQAKKWLQRCSECMRLRQTGGEPLCGPLRAEVG